MSNRRVPLRRVEPERILHQQGEALLRRDFADQSAQDDQLRWWHTRALHGAWGIAEGLNVSGVVPGGTAKLSPGLAFDSFGRELILDEVQRIPVPETADEYLLVLSFGIPEAGCSPPSGLCVDSFVPASGVRLAWRLRREFEGSDGVPLAILNEDDTCPPPFARSYVRPQARSRVGHGVVNISSQDLQAWNEPLEKNSFHLGWEFYVDTRAAGFTRPPYYFAEVTVPIKDAPPEAVFLAGRFHVAGAERDRFAIRYFSSARGLVGGDQPIFSELSSVSALRFLLSVDGRGPRGRFELDLPLRISWIGIEPRRRTLRIGREALLAGNEVNDEFHS